MEEDGFIVATGNKTALKMEDIQPAGRSIYEKEPIIMIAKVSVDVPSAQTDRLFDYLVPAEWQAYIKGWKKKVMFRD